jgi:hypothetical protein
MKLIWARRDVRVILAGVLCGTIFMAVVASVWWKPVHEFSYGEANDLTPVRSAEDDYHQCLNGNTVACDATFRSPPPRADAQYLHATGSFISWITSVPNRTAHKGHGTAVLRTAKLRPPSPANIPPRVRSPPPCNLRPPRWRPSS